MTGPGNLRPHHLDPYSSHQWILSQGVSLTDRESSSSLTRFPINAHSTLTVMVEYGNVGGSRQQYPYSTLYCTTVLLSCHLLQLLYFNDEQSVVLLLRYSSRRQHYFRREETPFLLHFKKSRRIIGENVPEQIRLRYKSCRCCDWMQHLM